MLREVGVSQGKIKLLYAGGLAAQTAAYTLGTVAVVWFFLAWSTYNDEFYTVETDYLKWVTRVPAFTVCPVVSGRFAARQLNRYSKSNRTLPTDVSFFTNLLRPGKNFCPGCPIEWPHGLPEGNFSYLIDILSPPCESVLLNCQWNGKSFPCCQHFQRMVTKNGVCYSLNSDQTDRSYLEMTTSFLRPDAVLNIESKTAFYFHITDRKNVYFQKPRFPIRVGNGGKIEYRFVETIALDSAWELTSAQRRCQLQGEENIEGFREYSFSACKVKKLRAAQMEMCGCRHHLLGGLDPDCNIRGLMCLDKHFGNKTKIKHNCKHECDIQEIHFVYVSINRTESNNTASVVATLTKPPTERIIYYAQTTYLEKFVGFACLTRLVTSASVYDALTALWNAIKTYTFIVRYIYRKMKILFAKESNDVNY